MKYPRKVIVAMRQSLVRLTTFDFHTFRPAVSGWLLPALGLAMLSALLIPLNLLATLPFHHDEALYATWALEIVSGHNVWLEQVPIDKPPLFLYLIAGAMRLLGPSETAARLPSLVATVATVGLTFRLGRKIYTTGVALLAAWLVALSPFTILFAPTAFTDPLLVTFVLTGCLAAVSGRSGWSGIWLALAIATKQQGVFFAPLLLALQFPRLTPGKALRFFFFLFLILLPVFLWELARSQSPGVWQLSLANYGGLIPDLAGFEERWSGFLELLRYGTASAVLNTIFLAGLPLLLIYDLWYIANSRWSGPGKSKDGQAPVQPSDLPILQSCPSYRAKIDWILSLFILAFLIVHTWFSFQIWERYLLGLIPLLALLLARILWFPWFILNRYRQNNLSPLQPVSQLGTAITLTLLLGLTLTRPVQDATHARYPLGSKSQALQGIKQVTAYLQGQVGANHTLYHRWLGTHWRFYLWKYPYDLQYWESPQALAAQAKPGHLIAFPSWKSDTEARLALAEAGLQLQEVTRAYTLSGYPSIVLYEIKPITKNSR